MTQDDADLIYDYLHGHYLYEDGDLIATKNTHGQRAGNKFGCVKLGPGNEYITAVLVVNKKKYTFALAWFVYIFFNKKMPRNIIHIDGNRFNNSIENLKEVSRREVLKNKGVANKGFFERNGRFFCYVGYKGGMISLGSYKESKEAHEIYNLVTSFIVKSNPSRDGIKEFAKKLNPKIRLSNKTGVTGVYFYKDRFKASITINSRFCLLGYFDSLQEAEDAYISAKSDKENVIDRTRVVKGFAQSKGRYIVSVNLKAQKIALGSYSSPQEAREIYDEGMRLIGDGCSREEIKQKINTLNPKVKILTNKRGFRGVNYNKRTGTYYARVQVNGKRIGMPHRDSAEEAHEDYIKAKEDIQNNRPT